MFTYFIGNKRRNVQKYSLSIPMVTEAGPSLLLQILEQSIVISRNVVSVVGHA